MAWTDPVRQDLKILANGDALRIAPALAEVVVPVEWVKSRRKPADSRRVLADLANAMREQSALVFFPSGRLAYLGWHGLQERPWLPTVVTLARRFEAPILPLHIRARNSWLFYALSLLSQELRDVTLFHELLNKEGRLFELTLGLPIDAADLPDDPADAIRLLQRHVEVELPRASASASTPAPACWRASGDSRFGAALNVRFSRPRDGHQVDAWADPPPNGRVGRHRCRTDRAHGRRWPSPSRPPRRDGYRKLAPAA